MEALLFDPPSYLLPYFKLVFRLVLHKCVLFAMLLPTPVGVQEFSIAILKEWPKYFPSNIKQSYTNLCFLQCCYQVLQM